METLQIFILILLSSFALFHFISAENPSGFISLDCGIPANSTYTEPNTGIIYESDAAFINSGEIHNVSTDNIKNGLKQPLWNLRNFPEGIRNCYKLKVRNGTKYLIRAAFRYGNYDGKRNPPEFDLYFGVNFWDSVTFLGDFTVRKEIVHIVSSSDVQICVVNVGTGIPFISALELRPLEDSVYETRSLTLASFVRLDLGSLDNETIRYKDDVYDRIWDPPVPIQGWTTINTSEQVSVNDPLFFKPAPAVMNTAATPSNKSAPMAFTWEPPDSTTAFFVYMYFAELKVLGANESRVFDVFLNGKRWHNESLSPGYLEELVLFSAAPLTGGNYQFSFVRTPNSTLPPILNALEVYQVLNFTQSETRGQDVVAIENIKAIYGIKRNWQGDPCAPRDFIWEGLNCSFLNSEPSRIISLDLSSSGLTGEIPREIANLKMLEILDLSNNNLSGPVPDFLTQLSSLRVLNIEKNKLTGLIPAQLVEKSNNGSLTLRFGDNPNLFTAPSKRKRNKVVVPVVASVVGFLLLSFLIAAAIFWRTKRRESKGDDFRVVKQTVGQSQNWDTAKRCYSYSDILRMTNNFECMLGEGGFGRVYYGKIENAEVAVKVLSPRSVQGYQQFQAEVELLMRVHHRNLTGLVGYCNEPAYKGLIYEYMGGGNLGSLMSDGKSALLNWEDRLHIAVDAAQGLQYLHSGIKPAIVHRDVKSSNILLDDNFRAKVSDFGLSRIFPVDNGATHVITNVVGTPGYLDPEYYTSYRLNEKSDVYGFGIVLLEIITGRPVLTKTQDNVTHIYQWVDSMVSQGDISSIIDPKLKEDFEVNTIWKAVEIAMSCASPVSTNRPTMSQVVIDLNECLNMELRHSNNNHHQTESVVEDDVSLFGPEAR
ncbi:putative leucine-rich repeat receptor-like protein kinase At2g19210 isoform X2 [Benincasa hispida]|uniref:putative leucine-rich repeat receptor-like protein kinase At2g19210 isoform X1 n=1 Tax=Benincasa hispida TaxID=102211 RepID=UPI001901C4B5|nr:putative leucine-rich repeat receptor-like protein kinase At2g19210 isoform X1 [Benincasa hispida]XP_038902522.1 putative leucine-rich repeat receptor-like protein kinase At2g19210 isoform X2 [Benincasa hispida]